MLNVLSCVTGLADRTRRSEAAAVLFDGLRAARDEYGLPGSANEPRAERTIEEHLSRNPAGDDVVRHVARFDIESTVDLALDTLDEIAVELPA